MQRTVSARPLFARTSATSFARPVEVLESRQMLSASPADAAAVDGNGFKHVDWHGQQVVAKAGHWIVDIGGLTGRGQGQVEAANRKLQKVDKGLKATKHLGRDGLLVVESAADASVQQVEAKLKNVPGFRRVEPDFVVRADATVTDAYYAGYQWGLNNTGQTGGTAGVDINAERAWDVTRGDGSVVVGVIDSGVDATHPDLAPVVWTNPGEQAGDGVDNDGNGYVDDVRGWDFYNGDNNPADDNGHGTHVAGTIAAAANDGYGVAGVARAQVMALKFLGADGSGLTSDAIAAINYATTMRRDHGVNVRLTNNSWGGGGFSLALREAVQAHHDAGLLFVAAAGNGGSDGVGDNNDALASYPANLDVANVVSVAATDHRDALGSFSNYGTSTVDLAAPGVDVLSTLPGGWGYASGTSMAAPHVAGVAALAWTLRPGATVGQVRSALLNGTEAVPTLAGKVATGGRLDAAGTLRLLSAPAAPASLSATPASSTQVNLAWADASANEDGFRIERSTDGGATFVQVGTAAANATTFADTGLTAGRTYAYRVTSYNAYGASAASNVATAATPAPALATPAAPTGLAAAIASSTQVRVTWTDASTNESGFRLERSTDGGVTFAQVATLAAGTTSYTNSGLTAGRTYVYRVRAYNAAGNSAYSDTAAIALAAPAAPTNLAATAASSSQVQLTWSDRASNETGYRIEVSRNNSKWSFVGNVGADATSSTVSGLSAGTTYYFRIRAYNAVGSSAYAGVGPVRTLVSGSASTLGALSTTSLFSDELIDV